MFRKHLRYCYKNKMFIRHFKEFLVNHVNVNRNDLFWRMNMRIERYKDGPNVGYP